MLLIVILKIMLGLSLVLLLLGGDVLAWDLSREAPYLQTIDPCKPSPCGEYADCRIRGQQPVCLCSKGYKGDPLLSCYRDPSLMVCNPSACGEDAICTPGGNKPVCTCPKDHVGDPLVICIHKSKIGHGRPYSERSNPCKPSPCGQDANCSLSGSRPICSCTPDYGGDPSIKCFLKNTLGGQHLFQKTPCHFTPCGENSECIKTARLPFCQCRNGYEGNPSKKCFSKTASQIYDKTDICNPSPCGINAICTRRKKRPICSCPAGYKGDPTKQCVKKVRFGRPQPDFQISDPCDPYPCGVNAKCNKGRLRGLCSCLLGYEGDPLKECTKKIKQGSLQPIFEMNDPCNPTPCGINTECTQKGKITICSCLIGYEGSPVVGCTQKISFDALLQDFHIGDSCNPTPCGVHAECTQKGKITICSCPIDYEGDPLKECIHKTRYAVTVPERHQMSPECISFPCGKNAECKLKGNSPECSCKEGYEGDPSKECIQIPNSFQIIINHHHHNYPQGVKPEFSPDGEAAFPSSGPFAQGGNITVPIGELSSHQGGNTRVSSGKPTQGENINRPHTQVLNLQDYIISIFQNATGQGGF